jgi:hypothetical protein
MAIEKKSMEKTHSGLLGFSLEKENPIHLAAMGDEDEEDSGGEEEEGGGG